MPAAAALPNSCLLGKDAVLAWHGRLLEQGAISPDAAQTRAVALLQEFTDSLTAAAARRRQRRGLAGRLRGWLGAGASNGREPPQCAGVYFYGGVGRGKSFLMDGFYLQLPLERKMRAHFHQFMRRLHNDLKAGEKREDPLAQVAGRLARRYDLICFDEFHVSDIADAMLLGRLLRLLLDSGVCFVMTSNYKPADLYPNGLARDRFLPAICLLQSRLNVFALDGDEDYRQRHLGAQPAWFVSGQNAESGNGMEALFDRLACGIVLRRGIKLGGRELPVLRRASDCVWLSFDVLCAQARGKGDYLELAERYAAVFLSDVPPLNNPALAEAARRFTWLVDILYDEGAALVVCADLPLAQIYGDGDGGENGRTLSRLTEMQGADYFCRDKRQGGGNAAVLG